MWISLLWAHAGWLQKFVISTVSETISQFRKWMDGQMDEQHRFKLDWADVLALEVNTCLPSHSFLGCGRVNIMVYHLTIESRQATWKPYIPFTDMSAFFWSAAGYFWWGLCPNVFLPAERNAFEGGREGATPVWQAAVWGPGLPWRRGKPLLASEARPRAPPDTPHTSPSLPPRRSSARPPCWRGCATTRRWWRRTGVWAVTGWERVVINSGENSTGLFLHGEKKVKLKSVKNARATH